jgi:hypothetical protein
MIVPNMSPIWFQGLSSLTLCFKFYTLDNKRFKCVTYLFTYFIFRFNVKINVEDGTGQGVFVIFDEEMCDLLGKHCHELLTAHEVVV